MTETKKTTTKAAPAAKNLAEALAQFQADLPAVTLDGVNPQWKSKFASLANINTIVLPKLSEHGLAFSVGSRVNESHQTVVIGKLMHTSGEFETAEFPVTQTDPQKVGQAFTYARRYTLAALTGIVADGDDDAQDLTKPEPRNLSNARAQVQQRKPAKADSNATDDSLKSKLQAWMGSDEEKRKAAMDAQGKGKLENLSGKALQEFMISKLGIE